MLNWTETPEQLRDKRKGYYEERRLWKGNIETWEHDGFGYIVSLQEDHGRGEWHLSRIDLSDYTSVGYRFYTKDQMEDHISRQGWRQFKQLTLGV